MNETEIPQAISAFSDFLKYGPIGLAGIMFLLTTYAITIRQPTGAQERLLRQFMYVAAGCFTLALAANFFQVSGKYPLHFQVIPLQSGARPVLPPPIIRANNQQVGTDNTYLVRSEVTAVVDVQDAMDYASQMRDRAAQMRQALLTIATGLQQPINDIQTIPQIITNNCPGGNGGVPASTNPKVIAASTAAVSSMSGLKSLGVSAAGEALPVPKE